MSNVSARIKTAPFQLLGSSNKKPWKRILYEKQSYRDNYVDPHKFLDQLNIHRFSLDAVTDGHDKYSYWTLFVNTSIIAQQFTVVVIFLAIYKYILQDTSIAHKIAWLDGALLIVGSVLQVLLQPEKIQLVDALQTSLVFLIYLRIVAPVLRTLTSAISEDTIHALAISFSTIHLVFHDYAYVSNRTEAFSGTLSLNAAMFTSIILASRLDSSMEVVVVFLLLAVIFFILFPNIARIIQKVSICGHLLLTCSQWLLATYLLYYLHDNNKTLLVVYEILLLLLWLVGPFLYFRVQVYKKSMSGPWDIAVIQ